LGFVDILELLWDVEQVVLPRLPTQENHSGSKANPSEVLVSSVQNNMNQLGKDGATERRKVRGDSWNSTAKSRHSLLRVDTAY
jgi:hypothetical protein